MLKSDSVVTPVPLSERPGAFRPAFIGLLFLSLFLMSPPGLSAAETGEPAPDYQPTVFPASDEGRLAIGRFRVTDGLKVELIAAEPLLANPVAFDIDVQGRIYVVETFRHSSGVLDIRGRRGWPSREFRDSIPAGRRAQIQDELLDRDLANRTVEDRVEMLEEFMGPDKIAGMSRASERLRLLVDDDGDGIMDRATVFAEGFHNVEDGIAAGVLARGDDVYFANLPHLWFLRDTDGDGVADEKRSMHHGFGVRVGFLGHDLHGLVMGPDGRLYFSIGDRGATVTTHEGKVLSVPDTGAVFRCDPDGSNLEIFATGLRNPQELAFDQHGNLFTGDNNSDGGDQARWVYVVEGGDSGWHIGWQFIERPNSRGPWNSERMWHPQNDSQPASLIPPIANLGNGPSGLAYYPGTGLPGRYADRFFLCDFKGSSANSLVHSFGVLPRGAGFELTDREDFISGVLVTDVGFGMQPGVYISDWVEGWNAPGKGRIYRIFEESLEDSALARETRRLLQEGMTQRSARELAGLLAHPDMRVRQEAQFALADTGRGALRTLRRVANRHTNELARIHAIWALGQIGREQPAALRSLVPLLEEDAPEIRAQAAKTLREGNVPQAFQPLLRLTRDDNARVRYFATMTLGKTGRTDAISAILDVLESNNDRDLWLRHAGVMALTELGNEDALLANLTHDSASVRMGVLLALRRLERAEIARFLEDSEPRVQLEAARAINDLTLTAAMPELARLIAQSEMSQALARRVINANYRVGTPETAAALARFAAGPAGVEQRVEALNRLAAWAQPPGRDAVTGLWRPVAERDATPAADAARPFLQDLLRSDSAAIQQAAVRLAAELDIGEAGDTLFALIGDASVAAEVRVEALKALSALNDPRLPDAVQQASVDDDETLRKEALRLQARVGERNPLVPLTAVLQNGTLSEKQNALSTLGGLKGEDADALLLAWMDRLLEGKVPAELQLDVLDAAAMRSTPEIQARLEKYQAGLPEDDPLAGYRVALRGGNAANGKQIFFERIEVSCFRCHMIDGEGSEVGPKLDGIGARQNREYLLQSIIDPNAVIAPGYETAVILLENGAIHIGIIKGDTDEELVIHSVEDGLVTIDKADIKIRQAGLSGMQEDLGSLISKQELRDLIEFMAGLK
ncbi:MAG TPA: PVC-type heme-binding CxxCH protein [Methylomirabilota bacterium]|nr:PVC-type heme-binding CxxCH protein [Methylomirabilota bacterium]